MGSCVAVVPHSGRERRAFRRAATGAARARPLGSVCRRPAPRRPWLALMVHGRAVFSVPASSATSPVGAASPSAARESAARRARRLFGCRVRSRPGHEPAEQVGFVPRLRQGVAPPTLLRWGYVRTRLPPSSTPRPRPAADPICVAAVATEVQRPQAARVPRHQPLDLPGAGRDGTCQRQSLPEASRRAAAGRRERGDSARLRSLHGDRRQSRRSPAGGPGETDGGVERLRVPPSTV